MIPSVNLTILANALGILPPSAGDIMAVVGVSTSGPFNTPAAFARATDIIANFGAGPTVEAACYALEKVGKPIVFVRADGYQDGSFGDLNVSFVGTSVPTLGATLPIDDFEAILTVVTGGTIGTVGIILKWSLDGGKTFSPAFKLGTANSFVFPTSGGVTIDFAAGTLFKNDTLDFITIAPKWTTQSLSDALVSLGQTGQRWNFAEIVGPCDVLDCVVLDSVFMGMEVSSTNPQYKFAICNTRIPNPGETEIEYTDSLETDFGDFSSSRVSVCAGADRTLSSVSRRNYRRPASFAIAARCNAVTAATDLGQVDLGPLPAVGIKDANQNPDEHDETLNPGLDDLRFCVLRSIAGFPGVYVNNPNIMATPGSDFSLIQYRRVMDIACTVTKFTLTLRLNSSVKVDATTGFIIEQDALDIEAAVKSALTIALLAPGFASSINFVLSRVDNILSTKTLTGSARIVPLGYLKTINVDIGFNNPALQVQAA